MNNIFFINKVLYKCLIFYFGGRHVSCPDRIKLDKILWMMIKYVENNHVDSTIRAINGLGFRRRNLASLPTRVKQEAHSPDGHLNIWDCAFSCRISLLSITLYIPDLKLFFDNLWFLLICE